MRRRVAVQRDRAGARPRNLGLLVGKRGRMRGFIVSDHAASQARSSTRSAGCWPTAGSCSRESVVEGGIEAAPRAFVEMLRGEHLGKVVVRL